MGNAYRTLSSEARDFCLSPPYNKGKGTVRSIVRHSPVTTPSQTLHKDRESFDVEELPRKPEKVLLSYLPFNTTTNGTVMP